MTREQGVDLAKFLEANGPDYGVTVYLSLEQNAFELRIIPRKKMSDDNVIYFIVSVPAEPTNK